MELQGCGTLVFKTNLLGGPLRVAGEATFSSAVKKKCKFAFLW